MGLPNSEIPFPERRYRSSKGGSKASRDEADIHSVPRNHALSKTPLEIVPVPSHNFRLEYAVLTEPGYYPQPTEEEETSEIQHKCSPAVRENQDSFCIKTKLQDNPSIHFFGVYDGHGELGSECSNYAKEKLMEVLSNDSTLLQDPARAYNLAFLTTNYELRNNEIDDSGSGTTAITVLVIGDTLFVANAGDSRAVLAVKEGNQIVAKDLSYDQTPFRKDECLRVKLCGARVLNFSQVEGILDPNIETWGVEGDGGDPPRLWLPDRDYPGTAFTRSIGDSVAESIGVIALPEVSIVQLTPDHLFFVVASDGVFEFLSSQTVVDMAASFPDPREACAAIVEESYKQWLEHDIRTDDITIIIVHIKGLSNSGASKHKSGKIHVGTTLLEKKKAEASSGTRSAFQRHMRSLADCQLFRRHAASKNQSQP